MSERLVVLEASELERLLETTVMRSIARLTPAEPKEVLTLEEAARFLGRSAKSVTMMVLERGLPAHYISEREPRFKRSELLAWLATLPTRPALAQQEDRS